MNLKQLQRADKEPENTNLQKADYETEKPLQKADNEAETPFRKPTMKLKPLSESRL